MKTVIVIPARFKSSRFPGKPLTMIAGKSLLRRTWERCTLAMPAAAIWIATDDERIAVHARDFGAQVVMTGADCLTGTDRVYEASLKIDADLFLDVQGDEPLIEAADILAVQAFAEAHPGAVVNGMAPILDEGDWYSRMIPKVVAAPDGRLLYMSRAPIPNNKADALVSAMRQVCVMAFDKASLAAFAGAAGKTPLEEIEDLEVLRFLEMGIDVRMVRVSAASIAVDLPDDVAKVEAALRVRGLP
ncbi:MAG: 3-deoxy-manno-octulosonate cytidylyltransferase [Magnetospirillum sp.]|nr:3-deoxy-manno-octulosonate cytidylyltransferase [Magnetospirillum sp.]